MYHYRDLVNYAGGPWRELGRPEIDEGRDQRRAQAAKRLARLVARGALTPKQVAAAVEELIENDFDLSSIAELEQKAARRDDVEPPNELDHPATQLGGAGGKGVRHMARPKVYSAAEIDRLAASVGGTKKVGGAKK